MVQIGLPSIDLIGGIDENNTAEAIRSLKDTQIRLIKEMEHALYNLDQDNFNDVEWGNITTPIYARIQDNDDHIAELMLNADRFEVMVSGVASDGKVTAASIVAAINGDTSGIGIKADHIDITGTVKFLQPSDVGASGSTVISGNRIGTGMIDAQFIDVDSLRVRRIYGTLSDTAYLEITNSALNAYDRNGYNIFSIGNGAVLFRKYGGSAQFWAMVASGSSYNMFMGNTGVLNWNDSTDRMIIGNDYADMVTIAGDEVQIYGDVTRLKVDYSSSNVNVPVINTSSNYTKIRLAFSDAGVTVSSGGSVLGNLLFD